MIILILQHEVLGIEVNQSVEQHLWAVSPQLFGLPQMFLFNTGDEVAQLIDRKLEVLHNFMQRGRERLVILDGGKEKEM